MTIKELFQKHEKPSEYLCTAQFLDLLLIYHFFPIKKLKQANVFQMLTFKQTEALGV